MGSFSFWQTCRFEFLPLCILLGWDAGKGNCPKRTLEGGAGISFNHDNFYLGSGGDPRDICISSLGEYSNPAGKREPWCHFPTCSECIRLVWSWKWPQAWKKSVSQIACSSIASNFLYSSLCRTEFIYYVLLPQKEISPFNLLLQVGNLFGKHRSTIITLYNGAFDSSSAIFLIIKVGEKGFFFCLPYQFIFNFKKASHFYIWTLLPCCCFW